MLKGGVKPPLRTPLLVAPVIHLAYINLWSISVLLDFGTSFAV